MTTIHFPHDWTTLQQTIWLDSHLPGIGRQYYSDHSFVIIGLV